MKISSSCEGDKITFFITNNKFKESSIFRLLLVDPENPVNDSLYLSLKYFSTTPDSFQISVFNSGEIEHKLVWNDSVVITTMGCKSPDTTNCDEYFFQLLWEEFQIYNQINPDSKNTVEDLKKKISSAKCVKHFSIFENIVTFKANVLDSIEVTLHYYMMNGKKIFGFQFSNLLNLKVYEINEFYKSLNGILNETEIQLIRKAINQKDYVMPEHSLSNVQILPYIFKVDKPSILLPRSLEMNVARFKSGVPYYFP